jgi:hypothetical protein
MADRPRRPGIGRWYSSLRERVASEAIGPMPSGIGFIEQIFGVISGPGSERLRGGSYDREGRINVRDAGESVIVALLLSYVSAAGHAQS